MKHLLLAAGLFFSASCLHAQDFSSYQKALLIQGKDTLRYRILYPENYKRRKHYPLIVFLHGSGERGRDNELQLVHGGDLFLKKEIREKFSAIVIFPQCPSDTAWSCHVSKQDPVTNQRQLFFPYQMQPAFPERMVKQLTDSLIRVGIADKNRIYIGGLSLGGFGTYDLVIRYPDYFAAAFTIAGACNVELMAKNSKDVPLWIFHGAKDDVVNPSYDRSLYDELKKKNADVKYTEYPDANHNSWDSAFAEPQLLPWLFSHHK